MDMGRGGGGGVINQFYRLKLKGPANLLDIAGSLQHIIKLHFSGGMTTLFLTSPQRRNASPTPAFSLVRHKSAAGNRCLISAAIPKSDKILQSPPAILRGSSGAKDGDEMLVPSAIIRAPSKGKLALGQDNSYP